MLPNGEAFAENGGISSSSSPIPDLPPPKAESDSNCNLETELLCDESFNEIIKEEVEEEEEDVSSDSLNERKRQRTDDKEEEDGNATEAVSDASKSRKIHEEEEQNGNQHSEQREKTEHRNQETEVADGGNQEDHKGEEESEQNEGKEDGEKEEDGKETEGGNQENNNGEEEKNEETEEAEKEDETEELPQCSTAEEGNEKHQLEEHRENAGGEDNGNRINSEQTEGKEDGAKEEEEKETEEQKQKAAEKGKRPLFEENEEEQKQEAAKKWQKTSLVAILPNFSKFQRGEPSHKTEGDQIQNSTPKVDTDLVDNELNNDNNKGYDYHRDLAILRAIYNFKFINGHLPYPHSDELHNHIMDLIPNLNVLGNDLTVKITAFEDNFTTVRILDGDNPEMAQPVEREIFDLSMQLWGNSDNNVGDGI